MTSPFSIEARFWAKVRKTDGCWEWTGALRGKNDYGAFRIGDRVVRAHRFSWELHNGPIPAGLWVLHHCDNPRCIRPDHLFLGTSSDNMLDCHGKGRHPIGGALPGPANPNARFTQLQVEEIRRRGALGEASSALAAEFGVHPGSIRRIIRRECYV